jgi:hypothetical protein
LYRYFAILIGTNQWPEEPQVRTLNKYFAFIDETQEGRYRLSIISIQEADLESVRKTMRELRLPGQSRLHMAKESDRRRKQILKTLASHHGWEAFVVESAPKRKITTETRQELFLLAAQHPFWLNLYQVVIEDSNERTRDKRTLAWLNKYSNHKFDYRFEKPSQDPALWLADAVGWAVAKGGIWKTEIRPRVTILTAP